MWGESVGIIDQIISLSFEPQIHFVLKEIAPGVVKQYKASAVEMREDNVEAGAAKKLLVGANVPLGQTSRKANGFHFTFFLAGQDATFAASEIKRWSEAELRQNSTPLPILEERISEVENKLKLSRVEALALEEKLTALRRRASEIAEADKIIALKIEANDAKQSIDHDALETARLRSLIDQARDLEDPDGIDSYRQELALNLEEAAKVTAVADRLNQRKKESALRNFLKKIELVKEMDASNPSELAQQVLQLRKKRRELENRLGITSSDAANEEF